MSALPEPTPQRLRALREAVGLTQTQMAELARYGAYQRWSELERGVGEIDDARWELVLLLTDQHPDLRVVRRKR